MNLDFSHLASSDISYIDDLYSQYQQDPSNVDETWLKFFQGVEFAVKNYESELTPEKSSVKSPGPSADVDLEKEFRVNAIIQSFRARGHLLSKTNPVRDRKDRKARLLLKDYGLVESDLDQKFFIGHLIGMPNATLRDIVSRLNHLYANNIGVEYMHCNDTDIRRWFRKKYEDTKLQTVYDLEKKKHILSKLNEAVVFENFLHTKYVGQKRFSLEGGENTIPALDAIINKSSELGVEEVIIGMAHRGRLNVLANIMGKTYEYIFSEFEGGHSIDQTMGDGDVKYHLGFTSQVKTKAGKDVYLKLMPNPSHLEAVAPVVLGYARAQSDILYKEESSKILPIIIHGDAAVAGQGVVYETLQMSDLDGYHVGGAIHFVINNQIGFTTDFDDARSSHYCTSVARTLDIPIIHVNGDDAEAVVYAVELAAEFRATFGKDIFIDMVCYRKHGHNESDEPKYTQPSLYKKIAKHPNAREVYKGKLIDGKQIEVNLATEMEKEFKANLQDRLNMVKQKELPQKTQKPDREWESLRRSKLSDFEFSPDTKVSKKELMNVLEALTSKPSNFSTIRKVDKLLAERQKRFDEDNLDWAICELLAYGSLLQDGVSVRMSGQDVIRGTFSHRHAQIFDENTNVAHDSLNNINDKQAKFRIFNSFLSEYAVLGFEFGYSLGRPTDINIWEAQFGDFANGAQTVFDQFISGTESKWQKMSGLFVLLPHGYEGQGPEHSNARPERFLQLAAEENMIIANCSTPANLFHLLRRQLAYPFRKPTVVFTPKSLLRHPGCVSKVEDLTDGKFREIIPDTYADIKKVKRVLFCTGKIYYDLLAYQQKEKRKDVAIIRVEQLYPLATKQIEEVLGIYEKANFVWVQEEPKNMGAWTYLLRYPMFMDFDLIGRKSSASPATGFASVHAREQSELVEQAFNI